MNAREIISEIVRRGHTVDLDGETLVIRPKMTEALRARVAARKPDLVAFLRELGGPPATAHPFVATSAADALRVQEYGVCISCGCPWPLHGEPPTESWQLVDDPNDAPLIGAAAIVASVVAESFTQGGH